MESRPRMKTGLDAGWLPMDGCDQMHFFSSAAARSGQLPAALVTKQ